MGRSDDAGGLNLFRRFIISFQGKHASCTHITHHHNQLDCGVVLCGCMMHVRVPWMRIIVQASIGA